MTRDAAWLERYRAKHPHLFGQQTTGEKGGRHAPESSEKPFEFLTGLPIPSKHEADIQAEIKQQLEARGFIVWEFLKGSSRGGSVWGTKGTPDLYVFRDGRALWLELKTETGTLKPDQIKRHRELRHNDILCDVATNLEEALAALQKAGML
jgi:hypothetical protein